MTFEKIAALIADRTDTPLENITRDTTFEEVGIDSLDTVELLMELEDDLGVEIELEEKVATVGEFVDFVDSKIKG
ncbi:MAG: acyl carrier protein [Oscillospiraceae bacterium]|nr:acyl carrier protein [Oscillospiraceae bacterium]